MKADVTTTLWEDQPQDLKVGVDSPDQSPSPWAHAQSPSRSRSPSARSQSPFELGDFFQQDPECLQKEVETLERGYDHLQVAYDDLAEQLERTQAKLETAQNECKDLDRACYHLAADKALLRYQLKFNTVITDPEEDPEERFIDLQVELTAAKQKLADYEAAKKPSAKKIDCTRGCGASTTAQSGVCRKCKAEDKVEEDAKKAAEKVRAKAAERGVKRALKKANRDAKLLGSDSKKKAKNDDSEYRRASVVSVMDMCHD